MVPAHGLSQRMKQNDTPSEKDDDEWLDAESPWSSDASSPSPPPRSQSTKSTVEERTNIPAMIQVPSLSELLGIISIPDLEQIIATKIGWVGISLGEGKTYTVEQNKLIRDGKRKDFTWVAIKRVKSTIPKALEENLPTSAEAMNKLKDVRLELEILSHPPLRRYPNIIQLLGCTWDEETPGYAPMLVMELADLGSLNMLLLRSSLRNTDLRAICADIASGLAAIHASGIVHGDVKLENVLMFHGSRGGPTAKISDFEHALLEYHKLQYRGTPIYNAPEIQAQQRSGTSVNSSLYLSFHHLALCDVFSYGLLAFEIFNHGKRYYRCPETEPFRYALLEDPLGIQIRFLSSY